MIDSLLKCFIDSNQDSLEDKIDLTSGNPEEQIRQMIAIDI